MNDIKEGLKKDDGKVRYELLPPELLNGVSEVLTFGAKKYTQKFNNIGETIWQTANVTKQELYTQKDCVALVTKNNSGKIILNTPNDKEKILENGVREIQNELQNLKVKEFPILSAEKEIKEQNSWLFSESSTLLKSSITKNYPKDALSAAPKNTYILITTIRQGDTEVYCVVNTTTVLASLETTFKVLKEHSIISEKVGLLEITGDRNWELGMNWSRVFGALMRHLWAWWNPFTSSKDEETGMSHLWHAGACLAFLITYESRNIGNDDRPNDGGQKSDGKFAT